MMVEIFSLKYLIITSLIKLITPTEILNELEQQFFASLMDILHVSHCIVIKNPNPDFYPLTFIKYLSGKKKFVNFQSVERLSYFMYFHDGIVIRNDLMKDITHPTKGIVLLQNNKSANIPLTVSCNKSFLTKFLIVNRLAQK